MSDLKIIVMDRDRHIDLIREMNLLGVEPILIGDGDVSGGLKAAGDFPPADADWFVYLAAHGFSWWLIGEVEETDSSSEDFGVQEDKLSPGVLGSPTPASSRRD